MQANRSPPAALRVQSVGGWRRCEDNRHKNHHQHHHRHHQHHQWHHQHQQQPQGMCDYILFSLIKIVYLASAPALLQQCIYKREKDDEVKTLIIIRENWKKT